MQWGLVSVVFVSQSGCLRPLVAKCGRIKGIIIVVRGVLGAVFDAPIVSRGKIRVRVQ